MGCGHMMREQSVARSEPVTQQQQQQQEPNILPASVQQAWDAWCDARINSVIDPALEGLADEVGTVAGQTTQKIFEILEIVQTLAVGNDFLSGRIDQISREFKHQNGIEHKEVRTIERTIATTHEERTSTRVQQVVRTIDEILAH
jgi:hypothetical protein